MNIRIQAVYRHTATRTATGSGCAKQYFTSLTGCAAADTDFAAGLKIKHRLLSSRG